MKIHPHTCWTNDDRAFIQNELAINRNAPLARVSTLLDDTAP